MHGNAIERGSTCSINGCQKVVISHIKGGDITASMSIRNNSEIIVSNELLNKEISVNTKEKSFPCSVNIIRRNPNQLSAEISLVCQTSRGEWEYLLVEEGKIVLIDGQTVLVKRKPKGI